MIDLPSLHGCADVMVHDHARTPDHRRNEGLLNQPLHIVFVIYSAVN